MGSETGFGGGMGTVYNPADPTSIGAARAAGARHKVLVHCNQGVSRSATCVCYWLMQREEGLTVERALERVRAAREVVHPNPGFMRQLRELAAAGLTEGASEPAAAAVAPKEVELVVM